MSSLATVSQTKAEIVERVIMQGDLSRLSPGDKIEYYKRVCESVGLNPLTKPFDYLRLNGREVLYATKGAAEQLRQIHKISVTISSRDLIGDVYIVTAHAQRISDGRVDESTGAVCVAGLKGEQMANAYMKAETKAKRRVTLSICGLNMLDETEIESLPNVERPAVDAKAPIPAKSVTLSKTQKIAAQLRAKTNPRDVLNQIEQASTQEELAAAAEAAKTLDEDNREVARKVYKARVAQLAASAPVESSDEEIDDEGKRFDGDSGA